MTALTADIFETFRPSFRIGMERPPLHYKTLKVKSAAQVLMENRWDLDLDIVRKPSFIKNMFLRTEDFVKAANKKPALNTLLPPMPNAATAGAKAKGGKVAGLFKAAWAWLSAPGPMPNLPRAFGAPAKKKPEYELD